MPIAAVPTYLGRDFSGASPGLRFGMYLRLWGVNQRTGRRLWTTYDENYRRTGRNREERLSKDQNKTAALRGATDLTPRDRDAMNALRTRQRAMFGTLPDADACMFTASSIAPFTTGLGNEHPLENGFAFLNPYGLPYLPGSGVKGAMRRAAEELAHADFFGGTGGHAAWTLPDVWHLFGFEPWPRPPAKDTKSPGAWEDRIRGFEVSPAEIDGYVDAVFRHDSEACRTLRKRLDGQDDHIQRLGVLLDDRTLHARGTVDFWDVIPAIVGDSLDVEIMTPHHSHYYQQKPHQGNSTPHDAAAPNPISFLTVPAGSDFTFRVRCDIARLRDAAPQLADDGRWKELLAAAFEHAFTWLGFGAKTAGGYGAMKRDHHGEARERTERKATAAKERKARDRARLLAKMDPLDRSMAEVIEDRADKNMPETTALIQALRAGKWTDFDQRRKVAERTKARMQKDKRWKETGKQGDKKYQNTQFIRHLLGEA